MTELHQTILMEAMLKYLNTECDRRKMLTHEYELIDKYQQELKDKEQEKTNALEYIDKIEAENKTITLKLTELQKRNENLEKENKQLHNDLITKIKSSNLYLEVHSHKEEELVIEIGNLKNKLFESENNINLLKKNFEQEKLKFEDELFVVNQKILKVPGLEKVIEQQKAKLEQLQKVDEEKKILESRLEVYELNIQELERNKDKLLEDCKKLSAKLHTERNEYKEAITNSKRNTEKIKQMENEIQALEDKRKYWEQRAKQSEEALQETRAEMDAIQFANNTGTLFSQEQELNYKKTIARLENQLSLMSRYNESDLAIKVGKLEGELEATINSNKKKEEELVLITKQHDELQKVHNQVLEQLELSKMNTTDSDALTKESMRTKKDKEVLLKLAATTKEATVRYEELKQLYDKEKEEYEVTKKEVEQMKERKIEIEDKVKEGVDKLLEYEKENIRLKERISVLLEERDKNEKLIKELLQQSEADLNKRITEKVKAFKEEMEIKLKEKDEIIVELERQLEECQEHENTILANYSKEIEGLNIQLEQERQSAKEGLVALAELGKSQEEMFANSIYEVEKLMKDMFMTNSREEIQEKELKKTIPQPKRLTRNITSLVKESQEANQVKQAPQKKPTPSRAAQPRFTNRDTQKK